MEENHTSKINNPGELTDIINKLDVPNEMTPNLQNDPLSLPVDKATMELPTAIIPTLCPRTPPESKPLSPHSPQVAPKSNEREVEEEEGQTTILSMGSGESGQLGIMTNEEDPLLESKIPRKVRFFCALEREIVKIECGGMHTLALSKMGAVFSWGCNDSGALGREGNENTPALVLLDFPMGDICCGDSHSVAYNVKSGAVYMWGGYRNKEGAIGTTNMLPCEMPIKALKKKKGGIQKICSGANHTLVLAGGIVHAMGDADNANLGRKVSVRRGYTGGLILESVEGRPKKNTQTIDIWAGGSHSFLLRQISTSQGSHTRLYGWGMNNWGQLGVGSIENKMHPTEIKLGKEIISVAAGENHTIALTGEGEVYGWGSNQYFQLGVPKSDIPPLDNELFPLLRTLTHDPHLDTNINGDAEGEGGEEESGVQGLDQHKRKKKKNEVAKENRILNAWDSKEEINGVVAVCPLLVGNIPQIHTISAGTFYTYALTHDGILYSWGMGESSVLGNKGDHDEPLPYHPLHPNFQPREGKKVSQIACGAQHVVALFGILPDFNSEVFHPRHKAEYEKQTQSKAKRGRKFLQVNKDGVSSKGSMSRSASGNSRSSSPSSTTQKSGRRSKSKRRKGKSPPKKKAKLVEEEKKEGENREDSGDQIIVIPHKQ